MVELIYHRESESRSTKRNTKSEPLTQNFILVWRNLWTLKWLTIFWMYVNEDNNRKNILLNADWAAFFKFPIKYVQQCSTPYKRIPFNQIHFIATKYFYWDEHPFFRLQLFKREKNVFPVWDYENFPPRNSRNLSNSFSSRKSFVIFLCSAHKWAFAFFFPLSHFFLLLNWIWRNFLVIYHFNRNSFLCERLNLYTRITNTRKKIYTENKSEVKIVNCILMDVFLLILLFMGNEWKLSHI